MNDHLFHEHSRFRPAIRRRIGLTSADSRVYSWRTCETGSIQDVAKGGSRVGARGGARMFKTTLRVLAVAIAVCALAIPAAAQVTTGTVTGNIKDAQGGVIPGATVTLISSTRGTTLATVTADTDGVYTFPNVPPDTYMIRVTMDGFKTLERSGVADQPRRSRRRAAARHRSRRPRRDGDRRRRGAADSVAERRAIVHGRHRLGPEPADQQPQLHQPDLARARRGHQRQQPGTARRRRLEQHADGRRLHGRHRQQPAGAASSTSKRLPK